ncbi:MAG TPA: zinc-binding dehydrogenase [Alphaproteobacteria bacterium]|nr:zinc-binding dehydrogenase [Alphaproteobacteria bacterium]
MKSKAAILTELNKPLIVDTIELPDHLEYGQVLVKIKYSGICGSQLGEISGVKGPDKYLPHLLGHEGGGIVEKVGSGVTVVKPGDHVVLHWRPGAGITSSTPKYNWNGKQVNAGWVTTFNEYAIVSENRVTPISKDVDLKTATLYGCALTTAYGVVHNDAELKSGESVVIFGAGGVGIATIAAAHLAGANPIIAVDINDFKLKNAIAYGATHVINSKNEDAKKMIQELVPKGLDVIIDTTGIKPVMELSYELTNNKGRTILVGVPKVGDKISIDTMPLHFGKKLTGSHGGDSEPSIDIPKLIGLHKAGRLNIDKMITHTFTLDQINEALEMVRSGDAVRVAIKMND